MTIRHTRFACWTNRAQIQNIVTIFKTYWHSIATKITRTRLNFTLYLHCPSCILLVWIYLDSALRPCINQNPKVSISLTELLQKREQNDTSSFKVYETWLWKAQRLTSCYSPCPGSASSSLWKQFLPWSSSTSFLFIPWGILCSCTAFTRRKFRYPIYTHTSYHYEYLYNLPDPLP